MAVGILNTAISGMAAFQRSLDVTSNNISNVSTEGYSRQRVELQSSPEQYVGHGYLGSGVNSTNIKRSYDEFITTQVRSSSTAFQDVNSFHALASRIDNLMADETTGLMSTMKSFFNSVNDLSTDPSSMPARQVMLSQAGTLTYQFNTTASRLDDIRQQVNNNLESAVKEVNAHAESIADLNKQISDAIAKTSGRQLPNELMDKRDLLLSKIAEKMDISVVPQPDGTYSIYLAQGQPLVLGNVASSMNLQNSATDQTRTDIMMNGQNVSDKMTGGEIYGNLRFRDQMLDRTQQQLGWLATGLAVEFNALHRNGFDLNGTTGINFFDLGTPAAQVNQQAVDKDLQVAANFVAPSSALNLGASYKLDVTGTVPDTFKLTNLSDNSTLTGLNLAALNTATANNGFSINFSGGSLNVGDTFQISPNFNIPKTIKVNPAITTPGQIAAASATGLPGDNSNALKLAALESKNLMLGGKSSFTQIYGQMVTDIGTQTFSASVSRSAQQVLLNQATAAREDLSGVNLDEEAANLIKFQYAYQAAAKAASVANNLFDALIGMIA